MNNYLYLANYEDVMNVLMSAEATFQYWSFYKAYEMIISFYTQYTFGNHNKYLFLPYFLISPTEQYSPFINALNKTHHEKILAMTIEIVKMLIECWDLLNLGCKHKKLL